MRSSCSALLIAVCVGVCVGGCDSATPGAPDGSFERPDADLVVDPDEPVALAHSRGSEEACAEWDEPAHPSPTVPVGVLHGAVPLFRHRDEGDPYMGDARFASDGSIRLLGPSARTFVRIDRDGSVAWERDVGGWGYVWSLAPDGSIFVAPSDERDVRERLLRILPDGTLVTAELAVEVGPLGLGINEIGIGPHGRVYLSNGSLIATCQGTSVEWQLSAFDLDGDARYLANLVVDESAAILLTVGGLTRALRISPAGERLQWMGMAIRSAAIDPMWTGTNVTAVFGTRAVVWARIDSSGWLSSSLASAGEEPINSPDTVAIDGLGRVIRADRSTRRGGWIWEQGDAVRTIELPCVEPGPPTFLEDGGLLCYAGDPTHASLRRVGPDGRVLWDFAAEHEIAFVEVDLDGRVLFGERTGSQGQTTLHVVQTSARPANGHWASGRPRTRWARRR